MTDRERLLAEADNCHDFILVQLADDAAERGDEAARLGYEYLRDKRKWPRRFSGAWWWEASWGNFGRRSEWTLPRYAFDALAAGEGLYAGHDGAGAALEAAALAVGNKLLGAKKNG